MPSLSSGSRNKPAATLPPPAPASMEERDWAALPGDILFAVFLRLRSHEIMEGAERACSSWRRVAVGEPMLWRCVDMDDDKDRQWSTTRRSRAMARTAIDRAAGRCEAFKGPCDDDLIRDLVERAPYLKSLRLSHEEAFEIALKVPQLKNLPLLEDIDISIPNFIQYDSEYLLETICGACPHLKKLRMSFDEMDCNYYDNDMDIDDEEIYVIPVMRELRTLELVGYNLTAAGLTAIIDNIPLLESLKVHGGSNIVMMDQELRAKCARVKNLNVSLSLR